MMKNALDSAKNDRFSSDFRNSYGSPDDESYNKILGKLSSCLEKMDEGSTIRKHPKDLAVEPIAEVRYTKILLGESFFNLPNSDSGDLLSKETVLVHESSHLAKDRTTDNAYRESADELAKKSSKKLTNNADSLSRFAGRVENTKNTKKTEKQKEEK